MRAQLGRGKCFWLNEFEYLIILKHAVKNYVYCFSGIKMKGPPASLVKMTKYLWPFQVLLIFNYPPGKKIPRHHCCEVIVYYWCK